MVFQTERLYRTIDHSNAIRSDWNDSNPPKISLSSIIMKNRLFILSIQSISNKLNNKTIQWNLVDLNLRNEPTDYIEQKINFD